MPLPEEIPCRTAAESRIVIRHYRGAALADAEKLRHVAGQIAATARTGTRVIVVVEAMGDTHASLVELAQAASAAPDRRELDVLLSTGEQICMALLAIALIEAGQDAISLTGEQAGIVTDLRHTNAHVLRIFPKRVRAALQEGKVVIVAGSQGVSRLGEVTTLESCGTNTTVVALGAVFGADVIEDRGSER
jgi:aspartate kinase